MALSTEIARVRSFWSNTQQAILKSAVNGCSDRMTSCEMLARKERALDFGSGGECPGILAFPLTFAVHDAFLKSFLGSTMAAPG